jgi:hypothetical protein
MATPDSIFGARLRGRFGTEQIAITRCHTRGKVCGLSALSAVNHCPATQAIGNAGKRALKVSSVSHLPGVVDHGRAVQGDRSNAKEAKTSEKWWPVQRFEQSSVPSDHRSTNL